MRSRSAHILLYEKLNQEKMRTVELQGAVRDSVGTKGARTLRKEGRVPCNIYGGGPNLHFNVEEKHLQKLVFTPNVCIVKLDVGGVQKDAVIREIQFHPVTDRITHVDFMELSEDKPVSLDIPVVLKGNALGVRNGGRLQHALKRLKVKALSKDLPDSIELDIEKLRIGQSIKVGDLNYAGLTFLNTPSANVAAIMTARNIIDDEEEELGEGTEGATTEGGDAAATEGEKPTAEGKKEEASLD